MALFSPIEILSPERTRLGSNLPSQKRVLEFMADMMADSLPLTSRNIFDAFVAREHLGTTAIGHGIAIPHARLSTLVKPIGCFVRLDKGIDYQAEDNMPVDLLFALLTPSETVDEAIVFLKQLAQKLLQKDFADGLRQTTSRELLYRKLIQENNPSF